MSLSAVTIEKVKVSELKHLVIISRETFYETFHDQNTETDMNSFLNDSFCEAQLTKEFNDQLQKQYFD